MNCSRMSPAGLTAIAIGIAVALGSGAHGGTADTPRAAGAAAAPAATSKPLPAPSVRRFDNAVLHVEITGKGRPLVLISGLATSGDVWRDAAARYSGRYECHAVTLGGFAGSPRFEGPFLETARKALLAYLREQKLEKPVIVGHSLGGVLALQLAIEAPDAIGPVVVLDAVPFLGGLGQPQATSESVRAQMEPMRKMIGGQTQEAYAAYQKSSPHLRGIVTGAENFARVLDRASTSHPVAVADAMADTARHFLMLDDPQWTWSAVNGFLDSLSAGRPSAGGGP